MPYSGGKPQDVKTPQRVEATRYPTYMAIGFLGGNGTQLATGMFTGYGYSIPEAFSPRSLAAKTEVLEEEYLEWGLLVDSIRKN
jgi:hypothetical protein